MFGVWRENVRAQDPDSPGPKGAGKGQILIRGTGCTGVVGLVFVYAVSFIADKRGYNSIEGALLVILFV